MDKNNREKKQTAMKTVGGGGEKRSWSDLPYEILELIKKGLFFIDQVNFRAVCKSWSCIERVPPLHQMPWLLIFDNNDNERDSCWESWEIEEEDKVDSCQLVDSRNMKTYTIDADVIKDKLMIDNFQDMKVHESKYGWLLISDSYYLQDDRTTLLLYSPFFSETNNFIELPVLNCKICFATFTSNPLDDKADCTVLALCMNLHDNTLHIYTHSRGHNSWNIRVSKCEFNSWPSEPKWMYSEGNLYFVTNDGTMGKFDMALGEWNVFPVLLPLEQEWNGLPHYIVKSSDGSELFLISYSNLNQTILDRWGCSNSRPIHRLDLSSMVWEDLDSIGDRVLFIGDGYNSILNSSVLKSNGEQKDISNKIYYCKDDELKYRSVHNYTLETQHRNFSDWKQYPKKNCSRHYGPTATYSCRKTLIDPPPR